MPVDIDYPHLSELPQKLPEKLKQIRERSGLTPEEFAPHVNAKDGNAIVKYESGGGELPMSVLMGYWKLSDVPLRNILDDDRDLWWDSCTRSRFAGFQPSNAISVHHDFRNQIVDATRYREP